LRRLRLPAPRRAEHPHLLQRALAPLLAARPAPRPPRTERPELVLLAAPLARLLLRRCGRDRLAVAAAARAHLDLQRRTRGAGGDACPCAGSARLLLGASRNPLLL